jgi:hypothetical protein
MYEQINNWNELIAAFFSNGHAVSGETIRKIASLFEGEAQNLEDTIADLIESALLDIASGALLDRIGKSIGVRRFSSSDDEYRKEIRTKILMIRSNGTINEFLEIAVRLFGASNARLQNVYPASAIIDLFEVTVTDTARAKAALESVLPSGVSLESVVSVPTEYFGFEDDPNALGFDEGFWAETI